MRIQILGTAAAEGWPAIFCGCDTCRRARAAGGKNIRSRASLLVNHNIKIDMGGDTYHHVAVHGIDLSKLEYVLITHSHDDHLKLGEFGYLRPPFAHNRVCEQVRVYGSPDVCERLSARYADPAATGFELHPVEPFKTVGIGDVSATPVVAVHKPDELCLNWVISQDGRTVLYASDTGPYNEDTYAYLSGIKLDMIITECTIGFGPGYSSHMSIGHVRDLKNRLLGAGTITPSTPVVITHFSHNVGLLHHELEAKTADDGFTVAYDGIVLEV